MVLWSAHVQSDALAINSSAPKTSAVGVAAEVLLQTVMNRLIQSAGRKKCLGMYLTPPLCLASEAQGSSSTLLPGNSFLESQLLYGVMGGRNLILIQTLNRAYKKGSTGKLTP